MRSVLFIAFSLCLALIGAQDASSRLSIPADRDICSLPADSGPCEAAIRRYFFNSKTKTCEVFTYGGCRGNRNNFKTLEACNKRCKPTSDICFLKPDVGPCDAAIHRWFFNPKSGKCEQFSYGGCEGNKNNFESRLECQKACRKDCKFVQCFANPCEVTKCRVYPKADCIPNFCNGCNADFLVDGKLVDCGVKPPDCLGIDKRCVNRNEAPWADRWSGHRDCCPGTSCCACGPPVAIKGYVPPKYGKCKRRCICPKG